PLRPATPTLDAMQILDLVRLRLESLQLAAGVVEIELRAESCAATSEQLHLFIERPTRDLDAANRALARLRAEFGDESVVCDKLTGPYVFSGGWWNREIQREYYFAETRRGDLLWLYYDRVRRRWFWQGMIE